MILWRLMHPAGPLTEMEISTALGAGPFTPRNLSTRVPDIWECWPPGSSHYLSASARTRLDTLAGKLD
jgi:hypothetical protein